MYLQKEHDVARILMVRVHRPPNRNSRHMPWVVGTVEILPTLVTWATWAYATTVRIFRRIVYETDC